MKRLLLGTGALLLLCMAAYVAFFPGPAGVPPEEVARRCAAARPAWPTYVEDIKAQVGATPVAQWAGAPRRARTTPTGIEVDFALAPPWSAYPFAMPVLLRSPSGSVYGSHTAQHADGLTTYRFPETAAAPGTTPWIELQYPHGMLRIALDARGAWAAKP